MHPIKIVFLYNSKFFLDAFDENEMCFFDFGAADFIYRCIEALPWKKDQKTCRIILFQLYSLYEAFKSHEIYISPEMRARERMLGWNPSRPLPKSASIYTRQNSG